MIETPEFKIAENPVEAVWDKVKKAQEQKLIEMKIEIEISEEILKLAQKKLIG